MYETLFLINAFLFFYFQRYSESEQGTRISQKASMLEKNLAFMTEVTWKVTKQR